MQNNNVIVRDILKKFKFYAEALATGKIISVKDGVARVNALFGVSLGELVQLGSSKASVSSESHIGLRGRGTKDSSEEESHLQSLPYLDRLKAVLVSRKIEIMFTAITVLLFLCLYLAIL
jgi:hypothetical protein